MTRQVFWLILCVTLLAPTQAWAEKRHKKKPKKAAAALSVNASVEAKSSIGSRKRIKLTLSRALGPEERIAVFIGKTDISDLFEKDDDGKLWTYQPNLMPLPLGESELAVYRVLRDRDWQELSRLPINVRQARRFDVAKIRPSLDINVKAQPLDHRYPNPPVTPARRERYADGDGRFRLETEHAKPRFAAETMWDVQGFSYRNDALRFAQKGNSAPPIDLASYRVRLRFDLSELSIGHVSFGEDRLLMDGFNSRGVVLKTSILADRLDFGVAALNGQSIVGAENFIGLDQGRNQIQASRVGWNVLRERGRMRVELTALQGELMPLPLLNQASLTDAERSQGWGIRITGGDPWKRLDFDAGFARSRFSNPADPLVAQNQALVPLRDALKGARYAQLQLRTLSALNLKYSHERADPEYKSVGARVRSNIVEDRVGAGGEARGIRYDVSRSRSFDNVGGLRSVMKNETRRWRAEGGVKLATLLGAKKRASWIPSLSYAYDHTHQLAVFVPTNTLGGSTSDDLPNLITRNHSSGIEWQFAHGGLQAGYAYHSVDNQRSGRGLDIADFRTTTQSLKANLRLRPGLSLGIEAGLIRSFSVGENVLTRTANLGLSGDWNPLEKTTLSASYALIRENNSPLTAETTNSTANIRVAQRLAAVKRCAGQVFVAYSQSLSITRLKAPSPDTHNNRWVLNSGLSLSFF